MPWMAMAEPKPVRVIHSRGRQSVVEPTPAMELSKYGHSALPHVVNQVVTTTSDQESHS